MRRVRLAIVDDALFVREGLRRLLENHERITVVGAASSGEELLANLDAWMPDVVTLDLAMPGIGGLGTLERLSEVYPIPVIILSTHSGEGAPITLEALSRGAADFIDKEAYSLVDFQALRSVLVEKILHVSRIVEPTPVAAALGVDERSKTLPARATPLRADLAVIGASTGGPRAIEMILQELGSELSVPVAIVQHMPTGFTQAFAERLNRILPLEVREAEDGQVLRRGVTIAPAGFQMRLENRRGQLCASIGDSPPDLPHRPSVDALFLSAAATCGAHVVAVLLTGMGADGAAGMACLAKAGAHTIAQHEASCVVYGMPRAAVELGAAREVLPLTRIGPRLRHLLHQHASVGVSRAQRTPGGAQ